MEKLLLSKRDAAKAIGCSHEKLNTLIKQGILKLFIDQKNGFPTKVTFFSIHNYIEDNSFTLEQLNNHIYEEHI